MKDIRHLKKEDSMWTLYPTWFRWKVPVRQGVDYQIDFISHMVQMKVFNDLSYCCFFSLYIPHGSDESKQPHYIF